MNGAENDTLIDMSTIRTYRRDNILVVAIDRPEVRNAVNAETAAALAQAFRAFDAEEALSVAILTGTGGTFCAGYDLKSIATGNNLPLSEEGDGPMGPTRMLLGKPVIAAIEGHAVAGGLELALWCDMRVAADNAVFGVYCRRFGVPLVDLGTVRLPRLIGHSHALDLILTGRGVSGQEALQMGLTNRLTAPGKALDDAVELAELLAKFPQTCMRSDRLSSYEQWSLPEPEAMRNELRRGQSVLASGESVSGAQRFVASKSKSSAIN